MKKLVIAMALGLVSASCVAETDWGSEESDGEFRQVEQAATAAQMTIINNKRAANTWLGDATSDFNDYSGGVTRNYQSGGIFLANGSNTARTMVHPQRVFWSWGGKSGLSFPVGDRYTPTWDANRRVVKLSKGWIISMPKSSDSSAPAWPIMNQSYGSMPINGDWGVRSISVTHNSTQLGPRIHVNGSGFPPNTQIGLFVSALRHAGGFASVVTDASGSFTYHMPTNKYVSLLQIASYNGISTVWARTADKGAAAIWSGPLVGYQGIPAHDFLQ